MGNEPRYIRRNRSGARSRDRCSSRLILDFLQMNTHDMIELPQGYAKRPLYYTGDLYTEGQMQAYARAAIEADRKRRFESGEALQRYKECEGDKESDPIERLRFYCSLAMSGQDWLDVEPFFEDLIADRQRRGEPVAWLYEDELPANYPYDTMFPYSKVDGVRMFPVYAPQPAEPSRGEPDAEREKWLASLFPEDRMFEEIDQMARESYKRHISLKRGQMVVRADSMDSHIVWATKRWIEKNEPVKVPSDAEIIALALSSGIRKSEEHWGDRYYTEVGSSLIGFARALLARYCKGAP